MLTTQALFIDPQRHIVVEPVQLPGMKPSSVRVKTACSYLSAATELTRLQMGRPNVKIPVTRGQIGYSLAGTVTQVGDAVTHVKVGDRVACVGQGAYHATEVQVEKNLVVRMPDEVSFEEAAPAAMFCFTMEGLRKARIQFGENVLVVGAGMMGQVMSQLAASSGTAVWLMDSNPNRLAKAPAAVRTIPADDAGWKSLRQAAAPHGIEVAFLCLGGEATEVYKRILSVMASSPDGITHGRLVVSGGATITATLASTSGNVQIFSSAKAGPGYRDDRYESGGDYPACYVPWTVKRNAEAALAAIARKQLGIRPLITHRFPYTRALEAYTLLAKPDTEALCVVLTYDEEKRA